MEVSADPESEDASIGDDGAGSWATAATVAGKVGGIVGIFPEAFSCGRMEAVDDLLVVDPIKNHEMLIGDGGTTEAISFGRFPEDRESCFGEVVE